MTAIETKRRSSPVLTIALAAALACGLLIAGSASADAPSQLWQAPPGSDVNGAGAGQLNAPYGIGVDQSNGHLYVADHNNARIDEFTPWGVFVKAFGWGVRNGAAESQTCGPGAVPPSACQKGIEGTGAGQMAGPSGVTVDGTGNIYVDEITGSAEHAGAGFVFHNLDFRVQQFNAAGEFLLMFGGEVDKTKSAEVGSSEAERNLCTKAEVEVGDVCGVGTQGAGKGQFDLTHPPDKFNNPGVVEGDNIVIGSTGTIFVGDKERIQEFEPDGEYKGEVAIPGEIVQSLAIDGAGDFYAGLWNEEGVSKLDPTGKELHHYSVKGSATVPAPEALAVDAAGDLYAVETASAEARVVEFAPDGSKLIPSKEEERPFAEIDGAVLAGLATSSACGIPGGDLYVSAFTGARSNLRAFGPPPDPAICPPPAKAPTIVDQYATSASTDSATLRVKINPHFWTDTRYYVEYGTGKCSEGGCETKKPVPPGALLPGAGVDGTLTANAILLTGLAPNTTYRYRFVASSGGGGPVYGADPDGEGPEEASFAEGTEASFTTPSVPKPPPSPDPCPNAANRGGASALLPDCRAYEMVSPVDKNGGDIVGICNLNCYSTELNQASADAEALTYSSYKAFAGSPGGLYSNQYIASRGASGWNTRAISPPRRVGLFGGAPEHPYETEVEFKAFSADLSQSWLVDSSLDPLTADAVKGFVNVYRRDNGAESYEALTRSAPTLFENGPAMRLEFQGASADGGHAIFQAKAALTPEAAATTNTQLYDYAHGELRLASVLPDGTANPQNATAGTQNASPGKATHGGDTLAGAISADGSRIFWTSRLAEGSGPGKLYVRIGGETTIPVSAGTDARFWSATPSGSAALYSEGENLFRFDLETQTRALIAHEALGVAGQSEDLSRIYFVSKKALAAGAVAGERNLYLDEEGAFSFIAALSGTDAPVDPTLTPSDIRAQPNLRMTRTSPDGGALAFMSNRPLSGYDSTDANSGEADWEVFVYDAATQQLACVSCGTSGVRPGGRELTTPHQLPGAVHFLTGIRAAAWIDTAESSLYTSRALSDNGKRLFFNSYVPLVARDTNGAQDVYEWEAPGEGNCTEESQDFHSANGGCVSLISSGESPQDSVFVDASPDGRDTFFKTQASLVSEDPGLIDVYDAREGGGFPPPPVPPPPCVGDACQSVPAPPDDPTPASAGFHGAGNPVPRKAKKHHKRRHKRRAHRHNRRTR